MTDWKLRDYQKLARDYLRERRRAALFLDMGLGKTAAVLDGLTPEYLPCLVVAPKKVAEEVWDVERDKWRPDLSLAKAVGGPENRRNALLAGADVTVISWDNFGQVLEEFQDHPFRTIVIDELSGYKDRSSARWKTMKRIITKPGVDYVWGLTGTPSPNGYMNLWAQIALLDGGERLGKNITAYRKRYFYPGRQLPNGVIIEWLMRPESEGHIKTRIQDICLAMDSDGKVKLPSLTITEVPVTLPPKMRQMYRDLQGEMVANVDIIGPEAITAPTAALLGNKLSQLCAGFLYRDDRDQLPKGEPDHYWLHNAKLDKLEEITKTEHSGGIMVMYNYIPERQQILARFGDQAHSIDEPGIIKKWNKGQVPILVAHPASAGHGLNLQDGGHHQVWTSLDWDLELWEQGVKRLHRSGQQHPVVVHLLLVDRSVDHVKKRSLVDKAIVQDDLLAHLESPV